MQISVPAHWPLLVVVVYIPYTSNAALCTQNIGIYLTIVNCDNATFYNAHAALTVQEDTICCPYWSDTTTLKCTLA